MNGCLMAVQLTVAGGIRSCDRSGMHTREHSNKLTGGSDESNITYGLLDDPDTSSQE